MKYAEALEDMGSGTFRRKDVLNVVMKRYPDYNTGSFNRHFSRFISNGLIENVGRGLYVTVSDRTAKETYSYRSPSERFSEISSFLESEFPLADSIVCETVQLNEFFEHQTAENVIVVAVEKMLTEAVFERMKTKFGSVMLSPGPEELRRYAEDGSVIIVKLTSRYPRNRTDRRAYSIEKLTVDIFAEKTIRSFFSAGDYPSALENIFGKYRINETALFNYARMRRIDAKIREMIERDTGVKLHTDGGTC